MRRTTALEVNTSSAASSNSSPPEYEVSQSPSMPVDFKKSPDSFSLRSSVDDVPSPLQQPDESSGPAPSVRLLFSFVSRRQFVLLILPAFISSVVAGIIAPFMTYVIGRSFDAFARFPLTPNPPQSAKNTLSHGVGLASLELVGLAAGALALSSLTSCLWIWTGECNAMALRKKVYAAVTAKDMVWFDTKMGSEGNVTSVEDEQGPMGAGGLMAKFARETDDVRMASSLASGMLVQYLTTTIACLVLAFVRSWSLTLVILSAVPILMFIQGLSQAFASPLLAVERSQTATAATLVDRAVTAIATVKAFNAATHEQLTLSKVLENIREAARKCNSVWGVTSSFAQFVMMAMFVQGFWYGARLVKSGSVSAGDVMAVFWACLIATSNLQMCIPQFIILAKGKFAMVSLISLVESSTPSPLPSRPGPIKNVRCPTNLKKIVPGKCAGELAIHNVSFAYPSRPTMPVLEDVTLFLPAHETTFIVGGSGSGKSTIAQLLLRMYEPQSGFIQLDDQDISYLDDSFTRQHLAGVSQGCILFDMSVHDNVAMGRPDGQATREEVVEACRAALMHEFVRDLPDGYDTKLGNGGANLSGGQKQRLAIARAKLRNPSVLILDEATSALDATSRILVFEAVKRWRANKTTVVITHDLSQISASDFVYVLKGGRVVEQGYRYDLEQASGGEFRDMMDTQGATGGFLPEKEDITVPDRPQLDAILEQAEAEKEAELETVADGAGRFNLKHQSLARPALRRVTLGNWMFETVQDLTKQQQTVIADRPSNHTSRFIPADAFAKEMTFGLSRRPSSIHVPSLTMPSPTHTVASRRLSLQFVPASPSVSTKAISLAPSTQILVTDDNEFDAEKSVLTRSAAEAFLRRAPSNRSLRQRWDEPRLAPMTTIKVENSETGNSEPSAQPDKRLSFWQLMREIYPTVPYKPVILFGLVICILSGAMTPLFSFLLSRLMFEVSIGARNTPIINMYGGIVLSVAALDGLFMGLKYFIMETSAMTWVTRIRNTCFKLVLSQDKKWFDKTENSSVRIVQMLIKDGDDARTLIGTVLAQSFVVLSMFSVGLIWAMVQGWQLTLVGLAIAPVFGITMAIQTNLVSKCEVRNKRAREDVAKNYYEAISNIRGIRSMAFERIFQTEFDKATDQALSTGVRGAFVEGCTYGVASALIYLAEALLFYVGAIFISNGTYTYLQMIQVLNLVVFTVSIGSQLMAFTQKIAKAVEATRDFNRLLRLSMNTDESRGNLRQPITGHVVFDKVSFSYPERPDASILKNVSMELADGECVAVVGASGSGKSTVAALLQRLYEPNSGTISVGNNDIRATDVNYLREHVAVVSQNPNLFDATISENISYGNTVLSATDIRRAAKAANVHDFIMSLPQGYDTMVGENASLISGGQAQRLQIARALARPSKILILDECTSALDPSNQAAVLETVRHAKVGRTTVMVTHKLPVMRMCDRILVIHDGEVAEHGTYEALMQKKGVFATLASGGEWVGE